jgi:hypothetical protein
MKNFARNLVPRPDFLVPPVAAGLFAGYWLNPGRRRLIKRRIGRAAFRNLYRTARNFATMLGRGKFEVRGDMERLQDGGILYSFHFGAWELMPGILCRLGYRLGVIANRYADQPGMWAGIADRFLYRYRTFPNVRIFYPGDGLKIARFLKSGGIFGVLVDGDSLYAKFDPVRRLGRLCGVPLVPFAVYRENGRSVLDLDCDLDKLLRERPDDYLWAYRSRGGN